ncbi:MAG TPA: heme exporter protein CcmB [Spirochaetota bacterium]|nr:heme exporter protein CcmB [Spirochaetota bacterium]HPS85821.1 heme exporter protein CcmB [Spirochaetota bacterium]
MNNRILNNIKKDFLIESRNRSAINISFAFAGITTLSVSLAAGGVPFTPVVHSIIFWIILFFSAMSGLAHIFIREEEEKNSLFLSLYYTPEEIYLSKLIFNIILFLSISVIVTVLYLFFLQVLPVYLFLFILTVVAGSIAIASVTTILGAMVSKAGSGSSLFTVISFPILLPVLWTAISLTSVSIDGTGIQEYRNILFLLAFSGVIVSVSYLSFKFIWTEL